MMSIDSELIGISIDNIKLAIRDLNPQITTEMITFYENIKF